MGMQPISSHFAPAARSSAEELALQRRSLEAVPALQQVLDALPDITAVLNGERQIVAGNRTLLSFMGSCEPESLAGRRPGELLGCVHAEDCDGGCGTSRTVKCAGRSRPFWKRRPAAAAWNGNAG